MLCFSNKAFSKFLSNSIKNYKRLFCIVVLLNVETHLRKILLTGKSPMQFFSFFVWNNFSLPGPDLKKHTKKLTADECKSVHCTSAVLPPPPLYWRTLIWKFAWGQCECIRSCYLPILSNLLKMSCRKTLLFVFAVIGVMEKSVLFNAYFKLLL